MPKLKIKKNRLEKLSENNTVTVLVNGAVLGIQVYKFVSAEVKTSDRPYPQSKLEFWGVPKGKRKKIGVAYRDVSVAIFKGEIEQIETSDRYDAYSANDQFINALSDNESSLIYWHDCD